MTFSSPPKTTISRIELKIQEALNEYQEALVMDAEFQVLMSIKDRIKKLERSLLEKNSNKQGKIGKNHGMDNRMKLVEPHKRKHDLSE